MTPQRYADADLFLNALVALKHSLEIRTTVFSRTNLDALLGEQPAAITFSRPGALDAERLLGAYMENDRLFRPITDLQRVRKWRCYAQTAGEPEFRLKELLDHDQVLTKAAELAKQWAQSSGNALVCAFIPEVRWTSEHDEEIRTALRDVVARSATDGMNAIPGSAAPTALRLADLPRPARRGSSSEREKLLRERQKMLDSVGTYRSEDLAWAFGSTTSNASQFAADLRKTGKLFGVRFGQSWHYPKFQFDSDRHVLPEIKRILTALSPDDQGWDRLQWFLEPHEALQGRTPVQVWKTDRQKVIAAAETERWDGRD